jgi:hypothetical protein
MMFLCVCVYVPLRIFVGYVRLSVHLLDVCVLLRSYVGCDCDFPYIHRMSVGLSVHVSDVCASPYICRICVCLSVHPSDVCVPFCTSPAKISPSFPFASLVIILTEIYSINFFQIMPQTTDYHCTENVVSFPFLLMLQ